MIKEPLKMNKCRVWKQIQRCTKSELLYIIEKLCLSAPSALTVENAYADLERDREMKQIDEANEIIKEFNNTGDELITLLKPYEGETFSTIPADVAQKAVQLMEKIKSLHNSWMKKMRCTDGQKKSDADPCGANRP